MGENELTHWLHHGSDNIGTAKPFDQVQSQKVLALIELHRFEGIRFIALVDRSSLVPMSSEGVIQ
jgi:hypothetical protein